MKTIFFAFFCLLPTLLLAQEKAFERVRNYREALEKGKSFATNSQYDSAINYYNAALAFEPEQKEVIDKLIKDAFEHIQKTVQQEQAQKTELVSKQEELRLKTQKAQEAEKSAKENEQKAIESQKKAEESQKETKKAEKAVIAEKSNAIHTLYYFNALDFAKYTGMVSDRTLRKQMALTGFLLLDSATEVLSSTDMPLEVLKAMIEAQGGIILEKEGENTHITWTNDSTFYFINHRNQSHLCKVKLQTHAKTTHAVMEEDSSFLKQPIVQNYIRKMFLTAEKNLFLEDDLQKKYIWKQGKLTETQDFVKDSVNEEKGFRTDFSGKIFKNKHELSLSHKGLVSQTTLSKDYFVSGGFDGRVILYRLKDDKSIVLHYNDIPIYSIQLSPNGKSLVLTDQKKIRIIFLDTQYLAQELRHVDNLPSHYWQIYKNDNNLLKQPTW